MITMGALEQGLAVGELQPMVDAWRAASPEIAGSVPPGEKWPQGGLWRDVENAAKKCIRTKARQEAAGCVFRYAAGMLIITLPSGRHLHYVKAHLATKDGKTQIAYWGVDQKTKRWGLLYTYGGKLCIAKGTPVLTRRGWIPIQNVIPFEEVWDGIEWVRQDGVAVKGVKETIKAHGVRMTPDHEILTEKGWRHASQSEGYNRAPCRLPDGYEIHRIGRQEINLGSGLVWLHANGLDQEEAYAARDVDPSSLCRLAEHARPQLSAGTGTVGVDFSFRGRSPVTHISFDFTLQSEEVFDLLNCGPRHRFVVADENGQPLIVHNCENIVQAFSRDILREILFELDDLRYHPVMLVHDEAVFEEDIEGDSGLAPVLEAMARTPAYAEGLPLKGAGFENDFYYKD